TYWQAFLTSLTRHMREKGLEDSMRLGHTTDWMCDKWLADMAWRLYPHVHWSATCFSFAGGIWNGGLSRRMVDACANISEVPYAPGVPGWKLLEPSRLYGVHLHNLLWGSGSPI